jgi:hypothetical protein
LRTGDEDGVGAGGLRAASRLRGGDTDHLGRNGGDGGFEFGANDGFNVVDADEDVLRFEVGVNDAALAVDVVETEEDLLGDLLADVVGNAAVVVTLDQPEEVLTQHLENHADVVPVRPAMCEVVEEGNDVSSTGVGGVGLDDSLKKLDLVERRFCVVSCRLDDLERDVLVDAVCTRDLSVLILYSKSSLSGERSASRVHLPFHPVTLRKRAKPALPPTQILLL